MQPMDVGVFAPLKRLYNTRRLHRPRTQGVIHEASLLDRLLEIESIIYSKET